MNTNKQKLMNDILDAISQGLEESLELTRDHTSYKDVDARAYNWYYSPNYKLAKLLEKQHEIDVSRQTLNNIINVIKENKNNLNTDIFTHYCFKMYIVNNHKTYKIYKSDNTKIDHPIYIRLFYGPDEQYGITDNRIIDDNIDLSNDPIKISINVKYINMEEFIYATLKHELTHVIEMYSAAKYNNTNNLKNTVSIDDESINKLPISNDAKWELNRMVYLCSNTEYNAHLNGLAELINKMSPTVIKKYIKDKPVYDFIINYKDGIDILTNLDEISQHNKNLQKYLDNNYLIPIFCLGYLLQKHHLIYNKTQINWNFIKCYKEDMYNSKYLKIASQICEFYENRVKQYREDIYKIVYKKFKEKKIIK